MIKYGAKLARWLYIVATLAIVIIVSVMVEQRFTNTAITLTASTITAIIMAGLYHGFSPNPPTKRKDLSPGYLIQLVGVLGVLWFTTQTIAVWVLVKYGSIGFDQHVEDLSDLSPQVLLLLSILVAPIGEEILLRGIVYDLLRVDLSVLWAAAISSVLFGFMHGNIVQIIVAIPLGFLCAIAYEKTATIIIPIVIHMIYNAASQFIDSRIILNIVTINDVIVVTISSITIVITLIYMYQLSTINLHNYNQTQTLVYKYQ